MQVGHLVVWDGIVGWFAELLGWYNCRMVQAWDCRPRDPAGPFRQIKAHYSVFPDKLVVSMGLGYHGGGERGFEGGLVWLG